VANLVAGAVFHLHRTRGTFKISAVSQLRPIDTPNTVERAADRLEAVRERVGDDVDFRGRVVSSTAKRLMGALEPHNPMYFEGPALPENADQLPRVERHTTVPLAIGERMYSRWEFDRPGVTEAVDVLQPSPSHAGGISAQAPCYTVGTRETRRLANAAGKAILGELPDAELDALLDGMAFEALTDATLTTAAELRDQLEAVRTRGVAAEREEWRADMRGLAAGFSDDGHTHGSIRGESLGESLGQAVPAGHPRAPRQRRDRDSTGTARGLSGKFGYSEQLHQCEKCSHALAATSGHSSARTIHRFEGYTSRNPPFPSHLQIVRRHRRRLAGPNRISMMTDSSVYSSGGHV